MKMKRDTLTACVFLQYAASGSLVRMLFIKALIRYYPVRGKGIKTFRHPRFPRDYWVEAFFPNSKRAPPHGIFKVPEFDLQQPFVSYLRYDQKESAVCHCLGLKRRFPGLAAVG